MGKHTVKRTEAHRKALSDSLRKHYQTNEPAPTRSQGKPLRTPFGDFASCTEASEELGITRGTISDLVRSDRFPDWFALPKEAAPPKREKKKGIEIIRVGKDRL